MPLMLLAAAAQAADLATMLLAITRHGIGGEVNPIARGIYAAAGFGGLAAYKLLLVVVILGTAYVLSRLRPRSWVPRAGLLFACGVGLLGAAANIVAVGRV